MKFLEFIKNYRKIKKVIRELEYRKSVIDISLQKVEDSLKDYGKTVASYRRKKMEFHKGKSEGYGNAILILEKFIDTGKLPDIEN